MHQFKTRQEGFKEIRNKALTRSIPLLVIAGAVGIIISIVNSKDKLNDVNILPIVIPIILIAIIIGAFRGVKRQLGLLSSYKLTITNNLITREQFNTPTISIYFNEVKEILKNKNGSFRINGNDAANIIFIPSQIDDYTTLESILESIKPITIPKARLLQKFQGSLVFIILGLMVCVYTVQNKIIVGISGAILVYLMLWSFFKIKGSKNIDARIKNRLWIIFIVLASIIGTVILKLTKSN